MSERHHVACDAVECVLAENPEGSTDYAAFPLPLILNQLVVMQVLLRPDTVCKRRAIALAWALERFAQTSGRPLRDLRVSAGFSAEIAPNSAPLIAPPRLENDPPMTSRTLAPPAAAPPAAEMAAPTPPNAAPEAPSAAAAAATAQRLAPSTAADAAAATSQRLSQSAPVAASSAAAPAAAQGTKTRWYDVDLESSGDEVDDGRPPCEFEVDGPPVVRVVTREKDEWRMMQASPVVKMDAMESVLRSKRPLLRIAALATFRRGGVRARAVPGW